MPLGRQRAYSSFYIFEEFGIGNDPMSTTVAQNRVNDRFTPLFLLMAWVGVRCW